MLKLSDPFEMDDLFVGIFYNAETEALANDGGGSQKSNQRLKQPYRRASAVWTKLLRAFEGMRQSVPPIRQAEALTTESRHLDAVLNESAASEFLPLREKEASEFRPLTEERKRQFLNSLDEKGRRIFAELAAQNEKRRSRRSVARAGQNEKRRSRRSVARVVKPNPVGIAPDPGEYALCTSLAPPMGDKESTLEEMVLSTTRSEGVNKLPETRVANEIFSFDDLSDKEWNDLLNDLRHLPAFVAEVT